MEFIAAKDLPVTEAEEVDVLCVENGEMKRKPANGLGGGEAFFLRQEDAYFNAGGTVLFVNPELFAELEGEVNGESVCSVRRIGGEEDNSMKFSEPMLYVEIATVNGLTSCSLFFDGAVLVLTKTTEDADALLATMQTAAAEETES